MADQSRQSGESGLLSVVVPCYNDQDNIAPLLARLSGVFDELAVAGLTCEVVLVDDGSPDATRVAARAALATFAHSGQLVCLQRNFGQHAAVMAGLEASRGALVVTMDSDMQVPPEAIAELLAAKTPEAAVVSGARDARKDPMLRRPVSSVISWWLRKQTGSGLRDFGSMFRLYERWVVDQLLAFSHRRRYLPALVAWLGAPTIEVAVPHEARGARALVTAYRG